MDRHAVLLTWDGATPWERTTAKIYVRADSPGRLKNRLRQLKEEYGADSAKVLPA